MLPFTELHERSSLQSLTQHGKNKRSIKRSGWSAATQRPSYLCVKKRHVNLTLFPPVPLCLCHLMHDVPGNRIEIEGHLAFVPIHISYPNGITARPNDPLTLPGNTVRKRLMRDLQTMGEKIGATVPHLTRYLPRDLWPETGSTLKYIEQFVQRVSPAMYIRCVDKGTGVMWAFCRHWVWGVLKSFLRAEGYTHAGHTEEAARQAVKQAISDRGWEHNKPGKLAMMYLIGKGKSLKKQQWLWRSITALPQPLVPKRQL